MANINIDALPAAAVATLNHTLPADNNVAAATLTEKVTVQQIATLLQQVYAGNYGGVAPVIIPDAACAIAFDIVTGVQWNYYSGAWH